ncbi:hypothetical protein, partial [Methylocella tundrae]|uniref:hypothetical protein n=1 Tax=Methylocella tundrae TaxID=227605 RepID=UPI001AEDE185
SNAADSGPEGSATRRAITSAFRCSPLLAMTHGKLSTSSAIGASRLDTRSYPVELARKNT